MKKQRTMFKAKAPVNTSLVLKKTEVHRVSLFFEQDFSMFH